MEQKTVAGEPVDLLRAAFGKVMKFRKTRGGMVSFSARLEPELGEPLVRAVQRIEIELFDHDAAHGGADVRTTEQRRADAYVILAERLAEAENQS